jgi:hypothetical protein
VSRPTEIRVTHNSSRAVVRARTSAPYPDTTSACIPRNSARCFGDRQGRYGTVLCDVDGTARTGMV